MYLWAKENVSLSVSEKFQPPAGALPEVTTTSLNEWGGVSTDFLEPSSFGVDTPLLRPGSQENSLEENPSGHENWGSNTKSENVHVHPRGGILAESHALEKSPGLTCMRVLRRKSLIRLVKTSVLTKGMKQDPRTWWWHYTRNWN